MPIAVLDYSEFTSISPITATSEGAATTIATITRTFDASQEVIFEVYVPAWGLDTASIQAFLVLFMDGNPVGRLWAGRILTANAMEGQIFRRGGRMIVSGGSHTFDLKGYVSATGGLSLFVGDGVSTNVNAPGYFALLDMQGGSKGSLLESITFTKNLNNVSITSTNSASPDLVVAATPLELAQDTACWIEFVCCAWAQTSTSPINTVILFDGSTYLGRIFRAIAWETSSGKPGIRTRRRVTLAAGTHSLKIMAFVSSASTFTIAGGTWPAVSTDQANHIEVFREIAPTTVVSTAISRHGAGMGRW